MNRLARPSKILGIQTRPRIRLPHKTFHARGLIIPSLSSAFLQLGETFSALPLPEAIPPYSATIIFTTILLRSCTTLPLAIWSKHAMRRFREGLKDDIKTRQMKEARTFKEDKRRKNEPLNEKSFEEFKTKVGPQLLEFQRANLTRKLLTRSPVFLAPVVVNAAALVTFTMTLRHLSLPPTPFTSELFFLSGASLAQTDPFGILPGAIGVIAMLNTEIRRALAPPLAESNKQDFSSRLSRVFDGLARVLSVAVVGFAMTNPVSVQIYWLTSFLFTSFESVLTTRLERRRAKDAAASAPLVAPSAGREETITKPTSSHIQRPKLRNQG